MMLQWRQPEPALLLAWAGLTPSRAAAQALRPSQPLAVLIGPPGPTGPSGSEGQPYEHVQSNPQTEWIVNHNRGFKPLITILSIGGIEIEAEVVHSTLNQARVYFNTATAGYAIAR